ncbi:uncharacterized protein B0I36DRAFT_432908 [Microdochium trichocladiopsis]|uniref:Uncharacterized protein n=1 Tax=Microdochium trichocladiopsis TaxID=1682393 RepID=A0A9P8Y226_9PEZI|nr:uncharacterized protein B0I36DRAFT_432908 [Microdochium trichocladiopsis]KAH7027691.1 hypothetical protein B0I36DRAFT_432908 [Microdochium trichocladiopsis]
MDHHPDLRGDGKDYTKLAMICLRCRAQNKAKAERLRVACETVKDKAEELAAQAKLWSALLCQLMAEVQVRLSDILEKCTEIQELRHEQEDLACENENLERGLAIMSDMLQALGNQHGNTGVEAFATTAAIRAGG